MGIFAAVFFVLRKWKVNPLYVMAASGVAGIVLYLIF